MIGRTDALATATAVFQRGTSCVVVPGGPGMGKTTLGLAIAHAPPIAQRFGAHRYFVALDSRRSAHDMLSGLCQTLGVSALGGVEVLVSAVARACTLAPRLVILDNFETPLERDHVAVEDILNRLAAVSGLTIIVTVRGQTPQAPAAHVLDDVQAMPWADARALFLRWAKGIAATDPALDPLLIDLDGHALSIVLLARLAEGQTDLRVLHAAYQRERVNLLKTGTGDHRLLSTRVSLRLSLQSPLMTSEAVGAVDLLAQSPAGLDQADLETSLDTLPGGFHLGALALLHLRLIEQRGLRLYMLAPLREAVNEEIKDGLL